MVFGEAGVAVEAGPDVGAGAEGPLPRSREDRHHRLVLLVQAVERLVDLDLPLGREGVHRRVVQGNDRDAVPNLKLDERHGRPPCAHEGA